MEITIPTTDDFAITGRADHPHWSKAAWSALTPVAGPATYATRVKLLYSATALYAAFDCADARLTCTERDDGDNLYTEDVVELFLQPDETQNVYLEYELSPLNKHLLLLVPNNGRSYLGWVPNPRTGPRTHDHRTATDAGAPAPAPASGAAITRWTAELRFPYSFFAGLSNVPPKKGTRWRANFYRMDYDQSPRTLWAWCRDVERNFHDMKHFGYLSFE